MKNIMKGMRKTHSIKMDERINYLAKNLVNYSMKVKKNDKVYVHYIGEKTKDLAKAVIKEVYAVGGIPFVEYTDKSVQRQLLLNCTKEQLELMAKTDGDLMEQMDCYVGIRGPENV